MYLFNLGPTENSEYHEMTQTWITSQLSSESITQRRYLMSIQNHVVLKQVILPSIVVGSEVHLLLGRQNTLLDPVLLKILPSHVGVYLSPFTDISRSRIIFTGLHKVFTDSFYNADNQFSHGIFDTMEEFEEVLTWITEIQYSITEDKQTGIEIFTPFLSLRQISEMQEEKFSQVISGRRSIIRSQVWRHIIAVFIKQLSPQQK